MKYLRMTVRLAGLLVCAASCKSQYDALLASNDVDAKYKGAMELFEAGKYQRAASLFESMAVLVSGTERDDTVQYYWGLSNYKYKDYYTAEANFKSFIDTYPRSPFTEEARFLRLDCLYRQTLRYELDPSPTYTAITALNEYVGDYPGSKHSAECYAMLKDLGDRMDRKSYEAARLYYKMEKYKAARVAFRNILKTDSDNIYREDILYYIAMSSYKYASMSVPEKQRERYLTFVDDYLNFVGEIPVSPYRKELDTMYARAQKALGRYSGPEDRLMEGKDKEFEKERKAAAKALKAEAKAEAKAAKEAARGQEIEK